MTTDQIQRFTFENFDIRGELVQLRKVSDELLFNRDYPEPIAALLAELIPAACLLSANLKFEGSLIIQAQNIDPLVALMAECTHDFKIRAIARWDTGSWEKTEKILQQASGTSFEQLLSGGHLAITISNKNGKRYQGIVPLEKNNLAGCLEDYFLQSEQLSTQIYLGQNNHSLGGMLIQRLPEARGNANDFQHVTTLADTITQQELTELEISSLLHRLFNQEILSVYPPRSITFSCSCSRERTCQALLTLSDEEFQELLDKEKATHVTCEFCGTVYTYDKIDLNNLKMNNRSTDSSEDQSSFH